MGSINSLGQAVQGILLNNYLKSNFENSEIRFCPHFLEFHKEKIFLKKSPLFQTLNANISRTAYHRKINDPILESSHLGISYEGSMKFIKKLNTAIQVCVTLVFFI